MSYYEDRMRADLKEIRTQLRQVSDLVERQLEDAVQSLFEMDWRLASRVVLGDREVNRRIKQIDDLCNAFIVRHAPSEAYLRKASAVLRLDVALERVGDYASSIGREVARLSREIPDSVAPEISLVADYARVSLEAALRAFHEEDEALARTRQQIPEEDIERAFEGLLVAAEQGERSIADIFRCRHMCNLLMRVAEQAENIREQAIFAIKGEVAERRAFRILFVDEDNAHASQLAEAYARQAFPRSGVYESAGWTPAASVDPGVVRFLAERGVDVAGTVPRAVPDPKGGPRNHVIVVLGGDGTLAVPFRTTLIRWDVDGDGGGDLERVYAKVTKRVDELMRTLAGPEAA